ncbi:MAG: tail protein X [Marivita sp.]|uniref:tail protein X n=1 Tax=Marivita sp. TaxID=2003365 RepID=UPI001B23A6C3|nr:tail protein X [Marivita sp.]MBO6885978.1 tail protein X [Marivita sp.]
MTDITERITVEGDGLTVSLLVWRRFHRAMPGLVERVYAMNPGLAAHGPTLPLGTSFLLLVPAPDPSPDPAQVLAPIRLW